MVSMWSAADQSPPPPAPRRRRWTPRLSLRSKLSIAFVAHSLVPVIVLSVVTLAVARRSLLDLADEAAVAELQLATRLVDGLIERTAADLEFLGETILLDDCEATAGVERTFLDLARRHPEYLQVRWIGSDGRERVRVDRPRGGAPAHAGRLQDKSGRYYVQRLLALAPGSFYLSPVDLNIENGRPERPARYVFRIGMVVDGPDHESPGIIVVNIEAEEILQALRPLRTGPGSASWILGEGRAYLRESGPRDRPVLVIGSAQDGTAAELAQIGSVLVGDRLLRRGDSLFGISRLQLPRGWAGDGWTLASERPTATALGSVQQLPGWLATLAVLIALVALVLAFAAARSLSAPLLRLTQASKALARGEFHPSFDVATGDEIEDLGEVLRQTGVELADARSRLERANEHLCTELDRQAAEIRKLLDERMADERRLLRADRLASIGLMSASLAHEIGNPLAGMKTNLQVAQRQLDADGAARRPVDRTLGEIDRLTEILRKWTGFARPRAEVASTTPRELVDRVWELLRTRARHRGVTLRAEGDALDDPLWVDGVSMEQVVLNILLNAVEAQDGPGPITVEARRLEGGLELVFDDSGPGIPVSRREHVFDAFHTTKAGGTGLGLAIVHKLVTEAGGDVEVGDSPFGGARFLVRLRRTASGRRRAVQ